MWREMKCVGGRGWWVGGVSIDRKTCCRVFSLVIVMWCGNLSGAPEAAWPRRAAASHHHDNLECWLGGERSWCPLEMCQ